MGTREIWQNSKVISSTLSYLIFWIWQKFDPVQVFLLRDILTSNTTHQQMVETLELAHRSKNLILGMDSFYIEIVHFCKECAASRS